MEKMLTVEDVADLLNISKSLVYDLADKGRISSYRPGNGRGCLRFKPEDVQAYLEGCRMEREQARTPASRPRLKHIKI